MEGCNYSRCGRTDKGVSAFSQIIALKVRSKARKAGFVDKVTKTELEEDEVRLGSDGAAVRVFIAKLCVRFVAALAPARA